MLLTNLCKGLDEEVDSFHIEESSNIADHPIVCRDREPFAKRINSFLWYKAITSGIDAVPDRMDRLVEAVRTKYRNAICIGRKSECHSRQDLTCDVPIKKRGTVIELRKREIIPREKYNRGLWSEDRFCDHEFQRKNRKWFLHE